MIIAQVVKGKANEAEVGGNGENIAVESELVTSLREKFNFNEMTVLPNLYENEGKTTETFSNEFKLLVGWNNLGLLPNGDDRVTDVGTEDAKATVSREEMEESIKSIFGSSVTYTDATFENIENQTFWQSRYTAGTVVYDNGTYTAKFVESGGADYPYINETIEKAVKYNDRIEIYVKTGFCKIQEDYVDIYTDLAMENKVGKIDVGYDITDETTIEKLNTYKYTFNLDNTTGEYYFAGIELAE
jgi:hypothetical protein